MRSAIAPETIVAEVAQNTVWNTRKPSVVVRGIGCCDVADNIEIFIDQRGLQAAGSDIECQ